MQGKMDFYKAKKLNEMSIEEWEMLCDGCGKCCFAKYVEGWGKKKKTYFTRICCNLFDIKSGKCTDYENRFKKCKSCVRISAKKVKSLRWLPTSCAYRLLAEGKELLPWHPLVSGLPMRENPEAKDVLIANPIHQKDVEYWEDFVIAQDF